MTSWRKIPEAGTVFGIRVLVLFARAVGRRIAGWFLYILALYYAIVRGTALPRAMRFFARSSVRSNRALSKGFSK